MRREGARWSRQRRESGIRSCLASALVGLMAGRVCLRYGWTRLALVVATIPIAIMKNALRISVLASLGAYVNPAFLHGRLHYYGGLVFTPLGVVLFLGPRRAERYERWVERRPGDATSRVWRPQIS